MQQHGFTLIELLIVMVIMMIIVTISFGFGTSIVTKGKLHAAEEQLRSDLRRTQERSLSGRYDGSWGVDFSEDAHQYVIFQGASYASRNTTYDEVIELPLSVEHSGVVSIIFDRVTGEPSTTGDITLTQASTNASAIISITSHGIIE